MRSDTKIALGLGGGAVACAMIVVVLSIYVKSTPGFQRAGQASASSTESSLALLRVAQEQGLLLRLDVELNAAWVNPRMWAMLPYDKKQVFASIFAREVAQRKGSMPWVDIKDNMTGKKLAYYGAYGFTVYE